MTSRERILAVLRGETPDRVPISPFIQEEYLSWYFQKNENDRVTDLIALSKEPGMEMDIIAKPHMSIPYFMRKSYPNWEVSQRTEVKNGNYNKITEVVTPEKTLYQVESVPYKEEYLSGIHFITREFLIEDQEDFEIFKKYCPKFPEEEHQFILEKAKKAKEELGDMGISAPWCYGSVFNFATTFMNIEDILVDALCEPEYYDEYMSFFTEIIRQDVEYMVESDYDVVGVAGNMANGSLMGSELFAEHILPYENRAVAPAIEAGKPVLYHNCGACRSLFDAYRDLDIDVLETICEPPRGDVTLAEAKEFFADHKLILCGTYDQVEFLKTCTPEEAYAEAVNKMEIGKKGGKFIFSASDYIEYGTPLENVHAFLAGARSACAYEKE